MGVIVAVLWGIAEATLFFIVPDVWLTRLAITRTYSYAFIACLAAVFGALVGGVIMLAWCLVDTAAAQALVLSLPAISNVMAEEVRQQLSSGNPLVLIQGAFSGVPYKLYAVYATQSGISLWLFLLVTIPARLARFVLTVSLAHWLAQLLGRYIKRDSLLNIWAVFWILFYSIFWVYMP
jgi:hypothetical protein